MIPDNEWDFSKLYPFEKEKEAIACWCYESAREFERHYAVRTKPQETLEYWKYQIRILPHSSAVYAKMIFEFNEARIFPKTPWLGLSEKMRKAKLAELDELSSLLLPASSLNQFLLYLENCEINEERQTWIPLAGDGESVAAIRIDWSKTDNELKEDFGRMLERLEPQQRKKGKKKGAGRRSSKYDLLRKLAVRRIVKDCGSPEAACEIFGAKENPFTWEKVKKHVSDKGQEVYSWERLSSSDILIPTAEEPDWPKVWFGHHFLKSPALTFTLDGQASVTDPSEFLKKN